MSLFIKMLTQTLNINYYVCSTLKIKIMSLGIFLMIGAWQYIIIGVVVLLLFGGKKIPELMKGLGSGIKEFKDASKEDEPTTDKKVEDNKQS